MIALLAGCAGQGPGLFERRIGTPPPATPTVAPTPVVPVVAPEPEPTGVDAPPSETSIGDGNSFATPIVNPDEDGGAEASAPPSDGRVGTTIAALGDPGEAGFWVKTPLVSAPTAGRVVYVTSGRSVQVNLIPLDGPSGGGSQISLAAMRLLDAPLTGLPELVVYTAS